MKILPINDMHGLSDGLRHQVMFAILTLSCGKVSVQSATFVMAIFQMSSEETSNLALDKPATEAHQEGETCEVDEDADNVGESEQHNWSTLTVAALKAELAGRGLQTSGRKADLVARLEASVMGRCSLEGFC
jgi:hypothetical protein